MGQVNANSNSDLGDVWAKTIELQITQYDFYSIFSQVFLLYFAFPKIHQM